MNLTTKLSKNIRLIFDSHFLLTHPPHNYQMSNQTHLQHHCIIGIKTNQSVMAHWNILIYSNPYKQPVQVGRPAHSRHIAKAIEGQTIWSYTDKPSHHEPENSKMCFKTRNYLPGWLSTQPLAMSDIILGDLSKSQQIFRDHPIPTQLK